MDKAPRYMKEFANAIKKDAEKMKKRDLQEYGSINPARDSQIAGADQIVKSFERGLITTYEAMRQLMNIW